MEKRTCLGLEQVSQKKQTKLFGLAYVYFRHEGTYRVRLLCMASEEVQNSANNALVNEVEERTKCNACEVNLAWGNLPSVFGLLIEVANKTCSLLNSAAIGFLLRSHVNQSLRDASPLSTRRGQGKRLKSLFFLIRGRKIHDFKMGVIREFGGWLGSEKQTFGG